MFFELPGIVNSDIGPLDLSLLLMLLGLVLIATALPHRAIGRRGSANLPLERLAEVLADGLILVDNAGRIGYVNEAAQTMMGSFLAGVVGEEASEALANVPELRDLAGGPANQTELVIGNKDGIRFYEAYAVGISTRSGHVSGRAIVVHDITQRRRAEEMLVDSEERYRSIFSNSIDGIFLTDPNGNCFAANQAMCEMLGQTEEELRRVGRPGVVDLSDPRFAAALQERARTGRFRGEVTYVRKDGTRFPVEIATALFKDRKGLDRAMIIARDITRRKQAETLLLQQQRALAVMGERERVARELHDDLGQVLGFINTQAQAVLEMLTTAQCEQARTCLDRMIAVVQEAQGDVRENILAMKTEVAPGQGLLPALAEYLERFGRNAGLRTTLEVRPEPRAWVLTPAAEVQVLRIVQEALANVRKHAAATRVRVAFAKNETDVEITIEDDGKGFDPAAVSDLGRSFGLRIMEERAAEIAGTVTILSAPGAGTKVVIIVPLDTQ